MSKLPADLHTASLQVHADDYLAHELGTDVAAPINVTTTFRYPSDSSKFVTATELEEKLQSLEIESKDIPISIPVTRNRSPPVLKPFFRPSLVATPFCTLQACLLSMPQ